MTERDSEGEKLRREIEQQTAIRSINRELARDHVLSADEAQQIIDRTMSDIPKEQAAVRRIEQLARSFFHLPAK